MSAGIRMLADNDIVLYNANVVDVENARILYSHTITVNDGKIVSVQPSRSRLRPGETDATGRFVMPGLIDSHVHYANACKDESSARALSEKFLRNGVTTVRDVGGNYLFIKEYNRLRDAGSLDGPDIYYSSIWAAEPFVMPSVHAEGADSENNAWSRIFSIKDSTDLALEKAVRQASEIGCTGFKLYINYSSDDLARLIPLIRKYGMKVWSHSSQVNGADAFLVASSGVDVMSHAYLIPHSFYPGRTLSATDREYTSKVLDEMLRNDVVLDMTVRLSYGSGTYFASEVARMAYEKGVKFVVGTDLPGCEIHNEIETLSTECAISNADILRAATVTGAEILGMNGLLGVVAEGAEADLLVLDENPLEDISSLEEIQMTISDGKVVFNRPAESGSMTLYNCNLVDTERGRVLPARTIVVQDGVITSVLKSGSSPADGDVDMTGRYVMPGMIDSHVHWGAFAQTSELSAALSNDFLTAGVTTVRDLGSNYLNIRNFSRQVRRGVHAGPRVFYSALWATGKYFMDPMDTIGWNGTGEPAWSRKFNIGQSTDGELEDAVLAAKAIGCTGFKLYINYSSDDLRRAAGIMKKHGMKVWAHATQVKGADALQVAQSGVEVMSHAYMLCNDITSRDTLSDVEREYLKKVCKTMRRNHVVLDATAHISMYEGQMQYCREIIRCAHEYRVKIAVGTDFFGNAMYEETKHLKACGLSDADILRSATCVGAEILGMKGKIGTISKGAYADMLVLDKNPLQDLSVLENIRDVIINGRSLSLKN